MIENSNFISMLQRASDSVRSGTLQIERMVSWDARRNELEYPGAVSSRYRGKISSY